MIMVILSCANNEINKLLNIIINFNILFNILIFFYNKKNLNNIDFIHNSSKFDKNVIYANFKTGSHKFLSYSI